ncbi:MAG: hypothetical protein KGD66_10880 [Candidatus Lokiarchaeota archaeon]|nr:hypothetical protein [Candidatus Lokiarchaeota archaeon]
MSKAYEEFMVYELENSGDRNKLDIKQEELQNSLNPEAVTIIVREDLRRIFIWKGAKSSVRKRFISSRVAQQLQKELIDDSRYHRCKIVSIDQGDELQEFLNAFKLESMEVTERLPDMRYIRNIERDMREQVGKVINGNATSNEDDEAYYSPALNDINNKVVMSSFSRKIPERSRGQAMQITAAQELISIQDQDKIKEKVLEKEIPRDHERQNLIIGHTLFGAITKVSEVFGKDVVEVVWEKVKKLPKDMIELDDYKLRVYLDEKKGIVEAVEVLKKQGSTQKEDKIDKQTSSNSSSKPKPQGRRELPKIPSNN